jgi:hypothetical protein
MVRDQFGNLVQQCYDNIAWSVNVTGVLSNGMVGCNGKGIYMATVTVFFPGTFPVSVTLNGTNVPTSFDAYFDAGYLSTHFSIADGNGVNITYPNIAGETTEFFIYSFNQYGVRIPTPAFCLPPSLWKVSITPDISVYAENLNGIHIGNCSSTGSYRVTFNATTALQYYAVQIYVNGTMLQHTYQSQILPNVMDPTMTIVSGLGNGTTVDNGTFYIQTRDKYGNDEFTATAADFDVMLSPSCANTTVQKTVDGGKLKCFYEVAEGGVYCIVVGYMNQTVQIPDSELVVIGGTACPTSCGSQGFCFRTLTPSTSEDSYSCNCFQGFTGEDCSDKSSHYISIGIFIGVLIVVLVVAFVVGLLASYCYLKRYKGDDHRPLIDH